MRVKFILFEELHSEHAMGDAVLVYRTTELLFSNYYTRNYSICRNGRCIASEVGVYLQSSLQKEDDVMYSYQKGILCLANP